MRSVLARIAIRTIAVVLAAMALHRFAYEPWHANHVLHEVERRTAAAAGAEVTRAAILARTNIEQLRTIANATQSDTNYYMLYAFNARLIGDPQQAIQQYTTALARADHRPEIYFNRGQTWLEIGNIDAAAADLTQAARFNPWLIDELSGELKSRVARDAGIQ